MFKSLFLPRVAEFIYIEGDNKDDWFTGINVYIIISAEDTLFYCLLQVICSSDNSVKKKNIC